MSRAPDVGDAAKQAMANLVKIQKRLQNILDESGELSSRKLSLEESLANSTAKSHRPAQNLATLKQEQMLLSKSCD